MTEPPEKYNPGFMLELLALEASNWSAIREAAIAYLDCKWDSYNKLAAFTALADDRFGMEKVNIEWGTYLYWRNLVFERIENERST